MSTARTPTPSKAGLDIHGLQWAPWVSVIGQGDDVVLDALVLQLLDVFRHCLLCAKQALCLGHSSISHRCQGGKRRVSLRQELGLGPEPP